jgi:Holliday junction resolvase-like predicted endonuclease
MSNIHVNPPRLAGAWVEQLAIDWWGEHYPELPIIGKNIRQKSGEIDFLAQGYVFQNTVWGLKKVRTLVVVEVRGRSRFVNNWTTGFESVDQRKQAKIIQVLSRWLQRHSNTHPTWDAGEIRFDVLDYDGQNFKHYPSAW